MPKNEFEGLPIIDAAESGEINVAARSDDLASGNMSFPMRSS